MGRTKYLKLEMSKAIISIKISYQKYCAWFSKFLANKNKPVQRKHVKTTFVAPLEQMIKLKDLSNSVTLLCIIQFKVRIVSLFESALF